MTLTLSGYVTRHISPEKYYGDIFPDLPNPNPEGEVKVLSPFVDEKVPSLSVNLKTGEWYSFCEADRRGGTTIVTFQAACDECSNYAAAKSLYHEYIHPLVDEKLIHKWQTKLARTSDAIGYLKHRQISLRTIKAYKIGWNGVRFTLPVYNEFGLCVNVRLYDPLAKDAASKMINYTNPKEPRSYGSPITLYPVQQVLKETTGNIVICEGEWDALTLISLNMTAVTSTGGASTWRKNFNDYLSGKSVTIAYDNDKPGLEAGRKLALKLSRSVLSLRRIIVPHKFGKDVNDLVIKNKAMRTKRAWLDWINKTKPLAFNRSRKGQVIKSTRPVSELELSIGEATNEKYFGKRISIEGIITSKDIMPYMLPLEYQIDCSEDCEGCPISETECGFKRYKVDRYSTDILSLLDMNSKTQYASLLAKAGLGDAGNKCKAKLKILSTFNVEFLLIIPTLEHRTHEYSINPSYYIGHGLKVNRPYRFSGYVLPHPKDQHAVFLFDKAELMQDEIETFQLTKECSSLIKFRPRNLSLLGHLMTIAEWQSRNVTKILERPDLHIVVDLAFHSVPSFKFNGELVNRGMLDVLVIGDTRCGKGYVAQGLSQYYGLGDVASGDSCSFAGLVGGLQQIRNNWRITWGLLPLNNNRLVIIDEASSMSTTDISRMSRIRSEGVAEIVKIVRESTNANTRLIWLANPRSGRPIMTYNTGVESIKELIGPVEDISRFDLALTLATNEVPSEVINTVVGHRKSDADKYTARDCRLLLLWAWSRTVDQVVFTPQATREIMSIAIELSQAYSPVIPLIQGETVRIKLAKLSAAIAARVFSTDSSHQKLIVHGTHVRCVKQLVRLFYNKPSMSYHLFSRSSPVSVKINDFETIQKTLKSYSSRSELVTITGLLDIHKITVESMTDYVGENMSTRDMLGELVVLKCLTRLEGCNYYLKNPSFTQWLRKRKQHLLRKGMNDAAI